MTSEKVASRTISVRVSLGAKRALTVLAHALGASEKDIASNAVRLFISQNRDAIREGLAKASTAEAESLELI